MNILFLDDSKSRITKFEYEFYTRKMNEKNSLDVVETSADCIKKLQEKDYDVILLDHDLGGEVFVDSSREDTGAEVVRWIISNKKPESIKQIFVHSHNEPARLQMVKSLKASGFQSIEAPFIHIDYSRLKEVIDMLA